jgi:hypothetical protein
MRVSSYAVARPAYYDRNAAGFISNYVASAAPHSETNRVTVTVAAGKKHAVEIIGATILRDAAAAVLGYAAVRAYITPSGGAAMRFLELPLYNNTVFSSNSLFIPPTVTQYPGDVLLLQTIDGSTTGSITFSCAYKATIFDS